MTGIYPAATRVFRPWKNGGGTTAEILCWPPGAGFDDFTLRLSTARVESSGAFSTFPGVDRVLTVIEGGAMVLHLGGETHALFPLVPFAFAGDAPCTATVDAPLLDFNVMTRRPLQARVTFGPLEPLARFALLLTPVAGLDLLDLLDLRRTQDALLGAVSGASAISIHLPNA
ncbi:MAG: HutD family protein [Pseudotabrizicola sp.]|uniref:HutD/Ves family protein n=1 Tax=Pseudotabrizicola sp. TaxID=2939647 RepID=UPI00271FB9CF|nr:HutD family protein [Pseudotabrizicola sp.]MDO8883470.1 HutD family protein [Pseudotabrizicola sp.]MDP2082518.1 HutD family protein [Pseudotabrizicola sp.]MDZ7573971.1 HutD family protein [Pseudotabrizicola sp.]